MNSRKGSSGSLSCLVTDLGRKSTYSPSPRPSVGDDFIPELLKTLEKTSQKPKSDRPIVEKIERTTTETITRYLVTDKELAICDKHKKRMRRRYSSLFKKSVSNAV